MLSLLQQKTTLVVYPVTVRNMLLTTPLLILCLTTYRRVRAPGPLNKEGLSHGTREVVPTAAQTLPHQMAASRHLLNYTQIINLQIIK